jgi:hypothetical protein
MRLAVPDHHDLRRGARTAPRARDRPRVDAETALARLRQALHPAPPKSRRADRHGPHREAGRLGRAREYTRAEANGDGTWRLTGHKWFLSAPMCDAFLVTAQTAKGLSCFFVPRWTPDGRLNEMRIQRFKDKLGDRSNAGTEMEFWGSLGWLVGEEGRGIPTVLEMGVYTRLDCAIGSTGIMRAALSQAMHHASLRAAFGKLLIDQPLMKQCAGRHGAGSRGRHRTLDAPGARLRRPDGRSRKPAAAHTHPGGEILDLQALPDPGGRGHGSAWRQRLCRRGPDAAPVPAESAEFHLGRLGQRDVPRHPARHGDATRRASKC